MSSTLVPGYQINNHFADERFVLTSSVHSGYSVCSFEIDELVIYIEGRIYGVDERTVSDQIAAISKDYFEDPERGRSKIADWVRGIDGDFIVLVYHKLDGRFIVFNDLFSRLPAYIYVGADGVALSRNYSFVVNMVPDKNIDSIAIATYMIMRYSFGDRTNLKNVYKLRPSELISVDNNRKTVDRCQLHIYNLDIKQHAGRSVKQNASALVDLFLEGVKNRVVPGYKNIMLLSGGLDSRAIAAALHRNGTEFKSMTISDANGVMVRDVEVAQKISSMLGAEWEGFGVEKNLPEDILEILRFKYGLVYLGKVISSQLLRKIHSDFGNQATLFGGAAGNSVFHDLRPTGISSVDQLAMRIFNARGHMKLETASKITGVSTDEILHDLVEHLSSFPEQEIALRYTHNQVFTMLPKWMLESADRHFAYFNSAVPFLSTKFFDYAMNCPDSQKKYLLLYSNFLHYLNPEMVKIGRAVNDFLVLDNVNRRRYQIWQWLQIANRWPNPFRFVFRKYKKALAGKPVPTRWEHTEAIVDCIKQQAANCSGQTNVFDLDGLNHVLGNSHQVTNEAMANLFTVTSAVESMLTGSSSIEKYMDTELTKFNVKMRGYKPKG